MRLFAAVCFSEENKDVLYGAAQRLRGQAVLGNVTKRENLHLTLAFIGEVPSSVYRRVCAVMDVVKAAPFAVCFDRFGKFRQPEGALYWIGAQENPALKSLQEELVLALVKNQIPADEKSFKPHITLGRRMVMEEGFSEEEFQKRIPSVIQKVTAISLMKSERVGGKLVYTEVYKKKLT